MTSLQTVYSAIGELAFSIACTDKQIGRKKAVEFLNMVTTELNYDFDVAPLMFDIMVRGKINPEKAYINAIEKLTIHRLRLKMEQKKKFISLLEKIAKAYPPKTSEEICLLDKFKKEIGLLGENNK